ncbi:hypothetical protein [Halopelagius fulvigenes]|uniref:HTH marR-type domain-containing protein n=1 Tax=Halopelagius fulvigenes TaxID=1198324 RepID=A0ABD5U146_9EURY
MSDRDETDTRGDGPRGYHGHLSEVYSESETLQVVVDMDERWVSAVAVADRLGCHHETARRKCNALVEEGRLQAKKPHPRRKFYALALDADSDESYD